VYRRRLRCCFCMQIRKARMPTCRLQDTCLSLAVLGCPLLHLRSAVHAAQGLHSIKQVGHKFDAIWLLGACLRLHSMVPCRFLHSPCLSCGRQQSGMDNVALQWTPVGDW